MKNFFKRFKCERDEFFAVLFGLFLCVHFAMGNTDAMIFTGFAYLGQLLWMGNKK